MTIDEKDPDAADSNFGGICVASALHEAHAFLVDTFKLEEGTPITSDLLSNIIAGALSIGGYTGAHLTAAGIVPPAEERRQLRLKFPGTYRRLVAVMQAHQAAIAEELDIDSKLFGLAIPAHRREGGGMSLGWTVVVANGAGEQLARAERVCSGLDQIRPQFAAKLEVDESSITWINEASAAPTGPLRELFEGASTPPPLH